MTSQATPQALLPSMRRLLAIAAVLVFLAGVQLFVFPTRTEEYFSWTIASPMTAVFLGAAYWSAVALEVAGAQARTWAQGRIAVPTVFVFTTLTLLATLLHLDLFHLGARHSIATRGVTWAWMAIYAIVPILMVVITVRQRRGRSSDAARTRRLPALVRLALGALVLIFGVVGVRLFLVPDLTTSWWPWQLTPLTSRAIGAWLISLGVAAAHSLIEDDVARIRPLGATAVGLRRAGKHRAAQVRRRTGLVVTDCRRVRRRPDRAARARTVGFVLRSVSVGRRLRQERRGQH
ncbi:MAG: hypothetical protein WKF51_11620 [Geodermatophilaceae bacterium]